MTDELKPCPFCGAQGWISRRISGHEEPDEEPYETRYFAYCRHCSNTARQYETAEKASVAWNTRPAEDALRAELQQQNELRRMEAEALIGAWNKSSRLLQNVTATLRLWE